MSEQKIKFPCRNHPDRIAAVDVGTNGEERLLCWDCYYKRLRKRERQFGINMHSKTIKSK
jgi:hypothetical protein